MSNWTSSVKLDEACVLNAKQLWTDAADRPKTSTRKVGQTFRLSWMRLKAPSDDLQPELLTVWIARVVAMKMFAPSLETAIPCPQHRNNGVFPTHAPKPLDRHENTTGS